MYAVKEIFKTIQGEGAHAGRSAVFCRFAGCNLWSGREQDRALAVCRFCDTDFFGTNGVNGGTYGTPELADLIDRVWIENGIYENQFVVFTGGEPLLQLDENLVSEVKSRGFYVAVETNGTCIPPKGIDWICMSPKANSDLKLLEGNELKFVFPQQGLCPSDFEHLNFERFFIQPMDGPDVDTNTKMATEFCLSHPKWALSLQMHKILGIP